MAVGWLLVGSYVVTMGYYEVCRCYYKGCVGNFLYTLTLGLLWFSTPEHSLPSPLPLSPLPSLPLPRWMNYKEERCVCCQH